MTKSKRTPGEWSYGVRRDGTIWLSIGDPKRPGAAHYQGDFCGTEADARLAVSAPALLAELQALAEMAHNEFTVPDSVWAAIAKATQE